MIHRQKVHTPALEKFKTRLLTHQISMLQKAALIYSRAPTPGHQLCKQHPPMTYQQSHQQHKPVLLDFYTTRLHHLRILRKWTIIDMTKGLNMICRLKQSRLKQGRPSQTAPSLQAKALTTQAGSLEIPPAYCLLMMVNLQRNLLTKAQSPRTAKRAQSCKAPKLLQLQTL